MSYAQAMREAALYGVRVPNSDCYGLPAVERLMVLAFLGTLSHDFFDWVDNLSDVQQRTFLMLVAEELEPQ